jgi:hypothetical protein
MGEPNTAFFSGHTITSRMVALCASYNKLRAGTPQPAHGETMLDRSSQVSHLAVDQVRISRNINHDDMRRS